jgi:Probable N6-adenine methyltransferase
MYELRQNEQCFFDEETLQKLSDFLLRWKSVCCLCTPLLGKNLVERGANVRILDIDTRFDYVRGFKFYDIHRPEWLGEKFDLIVCDPPFFNISLSKLFAAIRLLSQNDFSQNLLISYLYRRSSVLLGTFSKFNLQPTGYFPTYQTVTEAQHNKIEFYSNLPPNEIDSELS